MPIDCWCSIYISDAEGPSAFSFKYRVARKEHRCCECRCLISPGDTYLYESGIWEGAPTQFKTCLACESVRGVYFCGFEYGRLWEMLWEDMREVGDLWLDGRVMKIIPEAKWKVLAMVQRIWDED